MKYYLYIFIISLTLTNCKKDDITSRTINDDIVSDNLKLNEIQIIGSHNSYRKKIDKDIFSFLLTLQGALPDNLQIKELDYTHIPLLDQFYDYGIRQIELDIYLDPQGGRFYNRKGNDFVYRPIASEIEALKKPGIKIMHIPDIDFETHYITFIDALQEIKDFSLKNPNHIPIYILLEMKKESVADYLPSFGFTETLEWTSAYFDAMETEILQVFSEDNIIKPDDIRKNSSTLNAGLLQNGWPTIGDSRGKVMFLFSNSKEQNTIYKNGANSLENKLCFTNAEIGDDDAAFLMYNNPKTHLESIKDLVEQGYLIRTRADAGTLEARNNDFTKFNAALESGAQFISTDYYKPDYRSNSSTEWSNYSVGFENKLFRKNPVLE